MIFEFFDLNTIVLGLLATCLFAECIILVVRVNSLRNKMEAEAESIRSDELVKYEKKRNDLEMMLKEKELEIKSEYEDMLALVRATKREQEEKLAEAKTEFQNAQRAVERAELEYARFAKAKEEYGEYAKEYAEKLAKLSKLDTDEIRREAKIEISRQCKEELSAYRTEILENSKREADAQAREILTSAMQRMSSQMPQSVTTAIVKIPDDAMKGRLIGKEGRNIRSFEAETGTTLVIDESPDSVMISSFNPTAREIARIALENLILDGRINPSTIEQAVESAKESISERVYELGAAAADSLGLARLSPDILRLVGRLSFHLSLNQNTLEHSVETAKLCGMIAAELNCDVAVARRVGLLHDIGKVIDSPLSHALAGAEELRKAGESEIIANAVASHHNEVGASSVYAVILQIADSISATRTGARMEATEGYIRRIKTLESIAMEFEGVSGSYALQAGRELRVIVSPDVVSDMQAHEIARKIRSKIEESLNGTIPVKVVLIREQRFTELAKPREQ